MEFPSRFHEPKKENPEPNMRDLLARQNRKVIPIVGDRNSFFRAIAQLMYGSQEQHGRVRNEIVSYIEKHAIRYIKH